MTTRNRTKNSRQRGSHTHGWGAKKKHRGAGSRGGRGKAGSGKRADQKKPSLWSTPQVPKGFGHRSKVLQAINIRDIVDRLPDLERQGAIKKVGEVVEIDIAVFGKQKLLGRSVPPLKLKIKANAASAGAIKAVSDAGGEVIIPESVKPEAKVEQPKKESGE